MHVEIRKNKKIIQSKLLDMKQKTLFTLAIAGLLTIMTACGDKPIVPAQLPAQVQTFIKQYFPNQNITYAEKELDWFSYKYKAILADGTEVSFDTDNQWEKVDTRMTPVPVSLIPAPIATYVKTNFPAVAIVTIDKESYGYSVELANDLELKFNKQGALKELDD